MIECTIRLKNSLNLFSQHLALPGPSLFHEILEFEPGPEPKVELCVARSPSLGANIQLCYMWLALSSLSYESSRVQVLDSDSTSTRLVRDTLALRLLKACFRTCRW